MRGRWFQLFFTAVTLLGLVACSQTPGGYDRIEIVSDLSVLLTEVGDTAQLEAVVYRRDGTIASEAKVAWSSSDTSVIEVTSDGTAIAKTAVGFVEVAAFYPGLESAKVTVAVAQVTPRTRVIDDSEVVEVAAEGKSAMLAVTPVTSSLAIDDIVVSNAGILARVTDVRSETDRIVVALEPATLQDAFTQVSFGGTSEPLEIQANISASGITVASSRSGIAPQAYGLSQLKCATESGRAVEVEFLGGSMELSRNISLTSGYELVKDHWYSLPRTELFFLQADAKPRVTLQSPSLRVAAGIAGEIRCQLDIGDFSVPVASLYGAVNISGNVSPVLGFVLSAEFTAAELRVTGPSLEEAGVDATLGIRYENSRWSTEHDAQKVPGQFGLGAIDLTTDPTMSAQLGPYIGLGVGVSFDIGTVKGIGVEFAEPHLYSHFNLDIHPPYDVTDPDYSGPVWDVTLGADTDLKFELTGVASTALKRIGLDTSLASKTYPLFGPIELIASPTLGVKASQGAEGVTLSANGLGSNASGKVEFWALRSGESRARKVAEDATTTGGGASAMWPLADAESGSYSVKALYYDSVFGALELPYASKTPALVDIDVAPLPGRHKLTVSTSGNGSGTVTSSPTGIDCGGTCSATFDEGTGVTLTARAAPGSVFVGWGGDCRGSSATCSLAMGASKSVTASYGNSSEPPANGDPVISSFGAVDTSGEAPFPVTFSWSVADADGNPLTCGLDFGDGTNDTISNCAANSSAAHTYDTAGTYTVNFVVLDGQGGSSGASETIFVDVPPDPGTAPTVDHFDVDPANTNGQLTVTFDWAVSDADGDPLVCAVGVKHSNGETIYTWSIEDCHEKSSFGTLFDAPGDYLAAIVVEDPSGRSDNDSVSFTVEEASFEPQDVIANGDFDNGASEWTLYRDFWIGSSSRYHSSPAYASGGVDRDGYPINNAEGYVAQLVTIPAGATRATLSFWYYITTDEGGGAAYDRLGVYLKNTSGSNLTKLADLSNLNASSGYRKLSFDVSNYIGRTVQVYFGAETDGSGHTVFRIDDVSLMAE